MFALSIDDDLEACLLEERHAEALFALIDANRAHLGRWFPWIAKTTTVEHSRDFIRRSLRKFAAGDGFQAGIFHRGEHVGMIGTHYIDWSARTTELGYWLAQSAQGRGIMTRVVAGINRIFFEEYGLQRVEIRCHPDNARSRAVPERLGFSQEGVLRRVAMMGDTHFDHVVYGLLASEWAPARTQETI